MVQLLAFFCIYKHAKKEYAMNLTKQLFITIQAGLFFCFNCFFIYEFAVQGKRIETALESKKAEISEIVTRSTALPLTSDNENEIASIIQALLLNQDLLSIEISDIAGVSLAKAEKEFIGTASVSEHPILVNNSKIGSAVITLTDHYVRNANRSIMIEVALLQLIIFLLMCLIVYLIAARLMVLPLKKWTGLLTTWRKVMVIYLLLYL
jgi:hypothetical protein